MRYRSGAVAKIPGRTVLVSALAMMLMVLTAARVEANPGRGVISPSSARPLRVAAGRTLRWVVHTATALTPPPGIQQARALAGFRTWLCARGVSLGAPARGCFALSVRRVRPLDGRSLGYWVEVALPAWVAPSVYDLGVRYPGGRQEIPRAVVVNPARMQDQGCMPRAADPVVRVERVPEGVLLHPPASGEVCVRLHVGAPGLRVGQGLLRSYPLPSAQGRFARGYVALWKLPAGHPQRLSLRPPGDAGVALHVPAVQALAGQAAALRVIGPSAAARVFWGLDEARGAQGARVQARFLRAGTIEAVAIEPDGRVGIARAPRRVRPYLASGCAGGERAALVPNSAGGLLGLLFGRFSWTLRLPLHLFLPTRRRRRK